MPITIDSVTINGRPVTATSFGNDQFSASYTVLQNDPTSWSQEIVVSAHDQAGNQVSQTLTDYLPILATPELTIASPGGNTSEAQQVISGTSGMFGQHITLFDGINQIWTSNIHGWSSWEVLVTLEGQGLHTLTATLVDLAGNVSTSNSITYTLD